MNGTAEKWLSPQSTITVTVASGLVVAFTTTLCGAWPFLSPAVLALAFSAMFAFIQVAYSPPPEKIYLRPIFFIISALLVFHAARGGNITASNMEGSIRTAQPMQGSLFGIEAQAQSVRTVRTTPQVFNIGTNIFVRTDAFNVDGLRIVRLPSHEGEPELFQIDDQVYTIIGTNWYKRAQVSAIKTSPPPRSVFQESKRAPQKQRKPHFSIKEIFQGVGGSLGGKADSAEAVGRDGMDAFDDDPFAENQDFDEDVNEWLDENTIFMKDPPAGLTQEQIKAMGIDEKFLEEQHQRIFRKW